MFCGRRRIRHSSSATGPTTTSASGRRHSGRSQRREAHTLTGKLRDAGPCPRHFERLGCVLPSARPQSRSLLVMATADGMRSHVPALKTKLSLMMFLQFFIWGAWFELGFDYIPKLGFNNEWQLPLIF